MATVRPVRRAVNPMNRSIALLAVLLALLAGSATAQADGEPSDPSGPTAPDQGPCPVLVLLTYPPFVAVHPDCIGP